MMTGLNVATCLHCGRKWLVGDCIPSVCEECFAAGHRGAPFWNCPACAAEDDARLARIEAASKAAGPLH